MPLPAIHTYPFVHADWYTLSEQSSILKSEGASVETATADAHAGWQRLRWSYQHDATQEQVWTGLDSLVPHAQGWARALADAQAAIEDFITTGRRLQRERESLDSSLDTLTVRRGQAITSDDEVFVQEVREEIRAFNIRAVDLDSDWNTAQDTLSVALESISGGHRDGLPDTAGKRDAETNALDWAAMTSELDTKFGGINPDFIWDQLKDLDDEQLREWLEANPEAARALAEHTFPDAPRAGSPEALMAAAMANDAQYTEDGVAGIRETWNSLDEDQQRRMILLYPGIIGNLNGVPLATRGQTNQVTVAGLREQTSERLAEHQKNRPSNGPGARSDMREWEKERDRLLTVQSGLDQAWAAYDRNQYPADRTATPGYSTVFVSTDGNGQVATMRGEPSSGTERAVTFVPGTNSTIASVDHYNDALNAMDGHDPDGTVSIYWQGTDLPQRLVHDNATPHFNETGAPRLAAFDFAADLEMTSDRTRDVGTTYVGHSAGGSLLGTAERHDQGLDSTNIVYVAPAGTGHEVSSPQDTSNQHANRYLIQTNDDPIEWAQLLGGGAQGGSFLEGSNPVRQMDAVRLESGFMGDGSTVMSGHTDYFDHESTSAQNIEGVVYDEEVAPYLQPDIQVYPGAYQPTVSYPLETDLDHYREHGIPRVPVDSLKD
ncbi:alpha/beta hydrolase [Micrococcus terreus]|uniref:alpha/beta hydrolase n=1 Tax=Micrococcus terreus TaxID=574650 RepID=UPI00254E0255|nr:alpha/beta hydrolase [Micrococcus terreus]MDK7700345.1 alpha/beta hydrolase [Micrococcus terreus]WOO96512.1 alpha/beta hydrolase [Micrococcus terreus]